MYIEYGRDVLFVKSSSIYHISIDIFSYAWILFSNYDVGTFKCVDY